MTMRTYDGWQKRALCALLLGWTAFQLYCITLGSLDAVTFRACHALALLSFAFVYYRKWKNPTLTSVCCALCALAYGYLIARYPAVARAGGQLGALEYAVAAVGLLLLFVAGARVSPGLAALACVFLVYNFVGQWLPGVFAHNGLSARRVLSHLFWGSQGVFGVGLGASVTYVFPFMIFGKSAGGPAKVAVLASALLGMINGSAVANVASTGAITIPLMKKSGYTSEFAGAVEAAASTGGQFTPPVMGAVGFLMAEFLGVPYTVVLLAAIVPAFLYYLTLMLSTHFEAKRLGLAGLPANQLPKLKAALRERGHLLLPLFVLVGMLVAGFTPVYACVAAIVAAPLSAALRKETRMPLSVIARAICEGARGAVSVGVCCMLIGVIIGTVSLTGVGLSLSSALMGLAKGGGLYLTALAAMALCTVLGMGVPGVAAYVVVVAIAAPALENAGASAIAAHMFCLFYACLANITPPVAISAYVASGLSGGNQTKTALLAVRLGLAGFLVPFFFINNPALLMQEASVLVTIRCVCTACAGCAALSAALFFRTREESRALTRMLLFAGALLLLDAQPLTDVIGLAAIALAVCLRYFKRKTGKNA